MDRRRAIFSTLFWPSLYHAPAMLATLSLPLLVAGLVTAAQFLIRERGDKVQIRARERAAAITSFKLSGADVWQWRNELACKDNRPGCLPATLGFKRPQASQGIILEREIERPCLICHRATAHESQKYYLHFAALATPWSAGFSPVINFAVALSADLLFLILLVAAKLRRKRFGIAVVAADFSPLWKSSLTRRNTYYRELRSDLLRWVGAAEDLVPFLQKMTKEEKSSHQKKRLIAVHADPQTESVLPVETLRGVLRILRQTPPGTWLIQEALLAGYGAKTNNMRRLVFKNKSGASLKFVAWEHN